MRMGERERELGWIRVEGGVKGGMKKVRGGTG
jgi:hypothetical protein